MAQWVAFDGENLGEAPAITTGHHEATAHRDDKCHQQYRCAMAKWNGRVGELAAASAPSHSRRHGPCELSRTAPAHLAHGQFRNGAC